METEIKSIYRFRNDNYKIEISFELEDKETNENIRDVKAEDFLNILLGNQSLIDIQGFYLDEVILLKD